MEWLENLTGSIWRKCFERYPHKKKSKHIRRKNHSQEFWFYDYRVFISTGLELKKSKSNKTNINNTNFNNIYLILSERKNSILDRIWWITMAERISIMIKNKVVIYKRKRCMEWFGEFHWRNGSKVCRRNGTGQIIESW